jgi:predicted PolB exonuclease-like 3'-5' exonuclease
VKTPLYLDLETVVDESIPADKPRLDRFLRATTKEAFSDDTMMRLVRVPGEPEVLTRDASDDFPSLARWRIVSCGTFSFDRGFQSMMGVGATEKEAIEMVADKLDTHTLVTWNGRSFDVPLLCLRALALGIPLPAWYGQRGARYRYSDAAHFDVKDFVSDYGAGRAGSLDQVCRLVGLPGKLGVDGASVAGMAAEGRWKEIHAYCLCDVAQTALVERRVGYLRGTLTFAEMREDILHILGKIDEDTRLAELAGAIDRPRLLLD